MVFRGKPSGACLGCRQRRIKCDQNPSGCKSCKRAGMKCEGYRKVPQTMFHDETESVVRQNRSLTKAASPAKLSFTDERSIVRENHGFKVQLDSRHFQPNLDDFAICYFRACHFLLSNVETSRNYDVLVACMRAHGLATCAAAQSCPSSKVEARRYYLSALQKVNIALTTGDSSQEDDVLLAVMILGTIETITDGWNSSPGGWSSHVNGCAAILSERGAQQVRTLQGRLLFMQATACLTSQCLFSSTRLPAIVQTLTDEASKCMISEIDRCNDDRRDPQFVTPDKGLWTMHRALSTLTNINSDVKHDRIQDIYAVSAEILHRDDELRAAVEEATFGLMKDSGNVQMDSLTYKDAFDQYLAIQSLNSMRSCRMLLHVMIRRVQASHQISPSDQSTYQQASSKILVQMKSEILASIPYQVTLAKKFLARPDAPLGLPNLRQLLSPPAGVSTAVFVAANQILADEPSTTELVFFTENDPPILRISHGYNVLAALLVVGRISPPGSEDRKSTCKLLRLVGEAFDVRQAGIFADRLERQDQLSRGIWKG